MLNRAHRFLSDHERLGPDERFVRDAIERGVRSYDPSPADLAAARDRFLLAIRATAPAAVASAPAVPPTGGFGTRYCAAVGRALRWASRDGMIAAPRAVGAAALMLAVVGSMVIAGSGLGSTVRVALETAIGIEEAPPPNAPAPLGGGAAAHTAEQLVAPAMTASPSARSNGTDASEPLPDQDAPVNPLAEPTNTPAAVTLPATPPTCGSGGFSTGAYLRLCTAETPASPPASPPGAPLIPSTGGANGSNPSTTPADGSGRAPTATPVGNGASPRAGGSGNPANPRNANVNSASDRATPATGGGPASPAAGNSNANSTGASAGASSTTDAVTTQTAGDIGASSTAGTLTAEAVDENPAGDSVAAPAADGSGGSAAANCGATATDETGESSARNGSASAGGSGVDATGTGKGAAQAPSHGAKPQRVAM